MNRGESGGEVCLLVRFNLIEVEEKSVLWHTQLLCLQVKELVECLVVALPKTDDFSPIRTWGTFDSKFALLFGQGGQTVLAG